MWAPGPYKYGCPCAFWMQDEHILLEPASGCVWSDSRACLLAWIFLFFSHSDLNFQLGFNIGNSFFSFMQHHFLFQDQLIAVSRGHQKHSSWSWNVSAGSQFHSCMQSLASPGLQIHQCLVLCNFRWIHASVKKHTKTLQLTSSSLWRIQSKHKQGGNSVFSFTLWISGNGF